MAEICIEHCPRIIATQREYTHGLNMGYFDRAETNIVARENLTEATNELEGSLRAAEQCDGAVFVDGIAVCGLSSRARKNVATSDDQLVTNDTAVGGNK